VPPARREAPKQPPLGRLSLAFGGAVLLAGALIAVSFVGGGAADEGDAAPVESSIPLGRDALFTGIPQDGISLGRPDAPVTLVEYADLQCPYCADWSRDALPAVVEEYVRGGRVRLVFRGLAFLGPDSDKALRAALAAGRQDHLWDVVHALFLHQGAENSGWVSDELLQSLGRTGFDTDRMLAETASKFVQDELAAAQRASEIAGVGGTPFFQAGKTGDGLAPLQLGALDAASIRAELDSLLAG
jgi:protein-disulfide isomerase